MVLPQLCARDDQLARFVSAAHDGGAEHVHVLLTADHETAVRRFRDRAEEAEDAWTAYATESWDAQGGDEALRVWSSMLDAFPAVRVPSTDPESTYRALLVALGDDV